MTLEALKSEGMSRLVRQAWDEGQQLDLSGIGYGRIHWGNKQDVDDEPHPYYHFLAGLIRANGFSRVLEIGTHWGGATRAMWHGIASEERKLVTVDITTESDNRLLSYPDIEKVVGDANSQETMVDIAVSFNYQPIDMIYLDALHFAMPTFLNYSIYTTLLRPKIVVFDDITLNDEMKLMWSWVQRALPAGDTINAVTVEPKIRAKPGFGVVRLQANI